MDKHPLYVAMLGTGTKLSLKKTVNWFNITLQTNTVFTHCVKLCACYFKVMFWTLQGSSQILLCLIEVRSMIKLKRGLLVHITTLNNKGSCSGHTNIESYNVMSDGVFPVRIFKSRKVHS